MRTMFLIVLLVATPVFAVDEDAAALGLADKTVVQTEHARDWRVFTEAAWSESTLRGTSAPQQLERLSLGVQYDKAFAPRWRALFADRFDAGWQQEPSHQGNVNTLQDAYLSWQANPDQIADRVTGLRMVTTRPTISAPTPFDPWSRPTPRACAKTDSAA
jgi:hypothetical protein